MKNLFIILAAQSPETKVLIDLLLKTELFKNYKDRIIIKDEESWDPLGYAKIAKEIIDAATKETEDTIVLSTVTALNQQLQEHQDVMIIDTSALEEGLTKAFGKENNKLTTDLFINNILSLVKIEEVVEEIETTSKGQPDWDDNGKN